MKYFGDIPKEHLDLVDELNRLESWFNGKKIAALSAAKGMVCIAHDYYHMDMEEEGERLLRQAEALCPGYFRGPIISQMANDDIFYMLVEDFRGTLGMGMMHSLGLGK